MPKPLIRQRGTPQPLARQRVTPQPLARGTPQPLARQRLTPQPPRVTPAPRDEPLETDPPAAVNDFVPDEEPVEESDVNYPDESSNEDGAYETDTGYYEAEDSDATGYDDQGYDEGDNGYMEEDEEEEYLGFAATWSPGKRQAMSRLALCLLFTIATLLWVSSRNRRQS